MDTFQVLLNNKKSDDANAAVKSTAVSAATSVLATAQSDQTAAFAAKATSDAALSAAIYARQGDLTDPSTTPPTIYRSKDGTAAGLVVDVGIGLDEPVPAAAAVSAPPVGPPPAVPPQGPAATA